MDILNLLSNDGIILVNKEIISSLGLETAVILGELASEHKYWSDENKLTKDGFFYLTAENIEKDTSLSRYKQNNAINKLINLGILETKLMGVPAKRYFKINYNGRII